MSSHDSKTPGFFAQVFESLAPKANRVIATVAGIRTFFQGLTGSAFVAAGGGISLTAAGIADINWTTTTYAAIAVVSAALISGLSAFGNVLQNGLNRKYAQAVVSQITESGKAPSGELADAVTDAAAAIKNGT